MAGPYYENPPAALTVTNGTSKVLKLPYPNGVRLTKLNVVQTADNAAVTFSVDIYNHSVGNSPASNNQDDLWLITDLGGMTSNSAGVLIKRFDANDYFFFNQDAPIYAQAQGQNTPSIVDILSPYNLYVRITNTGSNVDVFNIILGSELPVAM